MRPLHNLSVCQALETIPGLGDVADRLSVLKHDVLNYSHSSKKYPKNISHSVHRPFAIDWYILWRENIHFTNMDEDDIKYVFSGKNRYEIVNNVVYAIERASEVNPDYGVLHGGNTNIMDVMSKETKDDDKKVIEACAEIVTSVTSKFPKVNRHQVSI